MITPAAKEILELAERGLSHDAFDSGLSTAIFYLLKAAKLDDVDLLSVIPSDNQ